MIYTLWMLTSRNIKVFVRNKMSVFFSFLSVFIIIGIYALFLGKVQVEAIRQMVGNIPDVRFLVDSWIISGLLAVNSVTVTLGVLGTLVYDAESKRLPDFLVAPIQRSMIVASHMAAACVVGFVFGIIALIGGELYIVSGGGSLLSVGQLFEVAGLLALAVLASSSVMYFVVSFIRSTTALGTLSTLLGTMIGFITGVYVPQGILPDALQKIIVLIPFSHAAALLRQVFCRVPLQTAFAAAPAATRSEYLHTYGILLYWGGHPVSAPVMLGILVATAALFLLLSAMRLRVVSRG